MWGKTFRKSYDNVSAKAIWHAWSNIKNWPKWHKGPESTTPPNQFKAGEEFSITPKKMSPVRLKLLEVVDEQVFTDHTFFFGAIMIDTHIIEKSDNGATLINKIQITGWLSWLWIYLVGEKVASNVERKMDALIKYTKHN